MLQEKLPEAERYLGQALAIRKACLGDSHVSTVEVMANQAALLEQKEELESALDKYTHCT